MARQTRLFLIGIVGTFVVAHDIDRGIGPAWLHAATLLGCFWLLYEWARLRRRKK